MKFTSFLRKSAPEVNDPRPITFRMIIPKTASIWFSHELCLGVYPNRLRWLRSDKSARRLATDLSTPLDPFFPNSSLTPHFLATNFTRLCEQWMFKLSSTNTHDASGSARIVCSVGLGKTPPPPPAPPVAAVNFPPPPP